MEKKKKRNNLNLKQSEIYELNNLGKNRNKILEKYRKTKALSI